MSVVFKADSGPLAQQDVRRALMIGTDLKAVVSTNLTEGITQCCPYNPALPTDIYTPIADLPAPAQELFTYDQVKAEQMIAEAYPDGFTFNLDYSTTRFGAAEVASLLEDMWSKLGLEVILQPHEESPLLGLFNAGTFEAALLSGGNGNAVSTLLSFKNQHPLWNFYANDEYYCETVATAAAERDIVKRNALLKELGIYVIEQCERIPMGNPYLLCCSWPWVKNYYGEIESGSMNYSPMTSTLWIDQDLKAEMGYK